MGEVALRLRERRRRRNDGGRRRRRRRRGSCRGGRGGADTRRGPRLGPGRAKIRRVVVLIEIESRLELESVAEGLHRKAAIARAKLHRPDVPQEERLRLGRALRGRASAQCLVEPGGARRVIHRQIVSLGLRERVGGHDLGVRLGGQCGARQHGHHQRNPKRDWEDESHDLIHTPFPGSSASEESCATRSLALAVGRWPFGVSRCTRRRADGGAPVVTSPPLYFFIESNVARPSRHRRGYGAVRHRARKSSSHCLRPPPGLCSNGDPGAVARRSTWSIDAESRNTQAHTARWRRSSRAMSGAA